MSRLIAEKCMETAYDLSSCEQNLVFSSLLNVQENNRFKKVNLFGFYVCEDGKQLLHH